jgi:RNA polymerase sigma-70 factor, ECF subfamily
MSAVTIDAETMRRLVAEAQQGDRVAADRLVREHQGWVRSAIYAVTGRVEWVDDIAQQVWARAWQRFGSLENPRQLRAWLYSIARNTALDYTTTRRRQQALAASLDGAAVPDRAEGMPPRTLEARETRETLLRAVQSLPALYREPFVLRHLENWSYAEIGELLGLPDETVETRLTRARRLLREMLYDKV